MQLEEDEAKVLIHFERWSARYDQWFTSDSDYLRPLESGSKASSNDKSFCEKPTSSKKKGKLKVGEEVLARWTDGKMYPGKVVRLFDDGSCYIVFYDGYRKKLKAINVERLPENYSGAMASFIDSSLLDINIQALNNLQLV